MPRRYDISQNLVSTPAIYVTADQKAFYVAKKRLYDQFSAFPVVLTQIIIPWTYDSQWRLEEREVRRNAEAEVRKSGRPVPPPVPPAEPAPVPPPGEPHPGFEEIFYDDPTLRREFVRELTLEQLLDPKGFTNFVKPGELTEITIKLSEFVEPDDYSDIMAAARDFDTALKTQGGLPWLGGPSDDPHLIHTNRNPIVYLNWNEKRLHIRMIEGSDGGGYSFPYAVTPDAIFIAGVAITAGTIIAAMRIAFFALLAIDVVIDLIEMAGIDVPDEIETTVDIATMVTGVITFGSLFHIFRNPQVAQHILRYGLSRKWLTKRLLLKGAATAGAGAAIWMWVSAEDKPYRLWKLSKACYDQDGNLAACIIVAVGNKIQAEIETRLERIIEVIKDVGADIGKDLAKTLTPILIVGGLGLAVIMFAKQKVGL